MKINDIIEFFGLPAQNPEFDQFLTAHGIIHRPVFTEIPVDRIDMMETGLSLVFSTMHGYRRSYGPPREDGEMIFSSLQAYAAVNDSGFSEYPGSLPYDLSFSLTLEDAKRVFGEPTFNHSCGDHTVYVWYGYQGNTIALCFRPGGRGVSFFDISRKKNKPPVPME